jgi:hypothetical protein
MIILPVGRNEKLRRFSLDDFPILLLKPLLNSKILSSEIAVKTLNPLPSR